MQAFRIREISVNLHGTSLSDDYSPARGFKGVIFAFSSLFQMAVKKPLCIETQTGLNQSMSIKNLQLMV